MTGFLTTGRRILAEGRRPALLAGIGRHRAGRVMALIEWGEVWNDEKLAGDPELVVPEHVKATFRRMAEKATEKVLEPDAPPLPLVPPSRTQHGLTPEEERDVATAEAYWAEVQAARAADAVPREPLGEVEAEVAVAGRVFEARFKPYFEIEWWPGPFSCWHTPGRGWCPPCLAGFEEQTAHALPAFLAWHGETRRPA